MVHIKVLKVNWGLVKDEPFNIDACFFASNKISTTKDATLFVILQWGCRLGSTSFGSKTGLRSSTRSFLLSHNPFIWRHNRNLFSVNILLQVCCVPTLESLLLDMRKYFSSLSNPNNKWLHLIWKTQLCFCGSETGKVYEHLIGSEIFNPELDIQ